MILMIGRKAQFFIISTIIISATLVSVQGLFSGYGEIDVAAPSGFQEDFIFNNIRSEINQTYRNYPCPDAELNLKELVSRAVQFEAERRVVLNVSYSQDSVCTGVGDATKSSVTIFMSLTTFNGEVSDTFTL